MAPALKRILCVDDEEDILHIAKLALEHMGGFEVFTCNGGKLALQQLEHIHPDLILLDAMMPQMDGPATMIELRKTVHAAKTPIVFMTARVQPAQIKEYQSLGAMGVITKPFDPITLHKEVTQLWEKFHGG